MVTQRLLREGTNFKGGQKRGFRGKIRGFLGVSGGMS